MISLRELQRPMLALEFTKWNLIWISDGLPLCELLATCELDEGYPSDRGRLVD